MNIEQNNILETIHNQLYKKDVDYAINIFLCGADTGSSDSIRDLLNVEFQKNTKFNTVYPEFIFATLLNNKENNLLELEDELAKFADVIVIPLEGLGAFAEIGAFTVNKNLLPKIIVINDVSFKNKKSFINLGPLDLINKHNSRNLIFFHKGKESDIVNEVIERISNKRYDKKPQYGLESIFNLSRFIYYIISIYQPITKEEIIKLLNILSDTKKDEKIKLKYIDAAIQILTQKNRIEKDIDNKFNEYFILTKEGHDYIYEKLLPKLKVKRMFSEIRIKVINKQLKKNRYTMNKELKLLELK